MATWRDGTSGARSPADLDTAASVVGSGSALPSLPNASVYPAGALFVLTTDYSVWRSTGSAWRSVTSAASRPYGNAANQYASSSTTSIANTIRFERYTIERTGTLAGMTVYVAVSSGNWVGGVYDPTVTNWSKLGDTPSVACVAGNTWQTGLDFSTPFDVVAGQNVMIAIHADNATSTLGRPGNPLNNGTATLPSGFIGDADGSNILRGTFNRGSFSSPLPNTISVASFSASSNGFLFYLKYA